MQRRAFLAVQWQVVRGERVDTHQGWGVVTLHYPTNRDDIEDAARSIARLKDAPESASVIATSMCWASPSQDE